MSDSLLLVDVDGVLIDKNLMWKAIETKFKSLYPDRSADEVRSFYRQHRGSRPDLDSIIEKGFSHFDNNFWRSFYEIDFHSLLSPGWDTLVKTCTEKKIQPIVYSEGSVGRRPWMPEYVKDGFQPYKVEQLCLGVPALVFKDKLMELPTLVSSWKQGNPIRRIIGLDDWDEAVETMMGLGIETYQFVGKKETASMSHGPYGCESFAFGGVEKFGCQCKSVESLRQMSDIILVE